MSNTDNQAIVQVTPMPHKADEVTIPFFDYGTKPEQIQHKRVEDAGYDIRNTTGQPITIKPHQTAKIPLGFGVLVPYGYAMYISPRSGHGARGMAIAFIPIDCGYTGEISAITSNNSEEDITIDTDERFGQFVLMPVLNNLKFKPTDVNTVHTNRGSKGFNSSGLK